MKKYIYNTITAIFIIFTAVSFNACDEFNTFPINIPISFEFTATGSDSQFDSGQYCLEQSDVYQDYQENVKSLSYIEAAYRTISISDPSVQGTINVQVLNTVTNTVIINFTLSSFRPADYISTPLILNVDQSQIDVFNTYLNSLPLNAKCFRVIVTITGVSGTQTLNGAVDAVFEAETEF
jgi:hypothetical protein